MNGASLSLMHIDHIFDKIPVPLFIADEDGRIQSLNEMAAGFSLRPKEQYLNQLTGDAFNCVHALGNPHGCGHGAGCGDCVIRNSIKRAIANESVVRKIHLMELRTRNGEEISINLLISASPIDSGGRRMALITLEDVSELMRLRDIIPICAQCKKIRTDSDYWENVETFLSAHADLRFSHGICPDCVKTLYPELADLIELRRMTMELPEFSLSE